MSVRLFLVDMDLSLLNCLRKFLLDSEKRLCGLLDGFVEIYSKGVRTFSKRFFQISREREGRVGRGRAERESSKKVYFIEIVSPKVTRFRLQTTKSPKKAKRANKNVCLPPFLFVFALIDWLKI